MLGFLPHEPRRGEKNIAGKCHLSVLKEAERIVGSGSHVRETAPAEQLKAPRQSLRAFDSPGVIAFYHARPPFTRTNTLAAIGCRTKS
jgi:hypothetical protein